MDDMNSPVPTITIELHDRIAQYRTALVALVDLIKREGGYRSWPDQMLVAQVERLLDSDK